MPKFMRQVETPEAITFLHTTMSISLQFYLSGFGIKDIPMTKIQVSVTLRVTQTTLTLFAEV